MTKKYEKIDGHTLENPIPAIIYIREPVTAIVYDSTEVARNNAHEGMEILALVDKTDMSEKELAEFEKAYSILDQQAKLPNGYRVQFSLSAQRSGSGFGLENQIISEFLEDLRADGEFDAKPMLFFKDGKWGDVAPETR